MCLCRGGLVIPPKQILHIIDLNLKKNTYKIIIKTISCCYSLTALIQQYAEVLNYNLMWRNLNNTSGWPDNLKSGHIVRETPAPDVIFWIPRPVFIFCRTNRYIERFSLSYPHRYAAAGQIACRIRTYGIERVCLHAVPFLPYPYCRIPRIWNLSLRQLVKKRTGNLEYDVMGRCFPNNLAGF